MTNEKAIETLKQLILQGTDERLKNDYEAIDLAIKALETGEIYMTGEDYNLYMEGYKAGKKDFAPKQGEWINEWQEIKGGRVYGACCSLCHINGHSGYNFCPNCGADMRGEHNE